MNLFNNSYTLNFSYILNTKNSTIMKKNQVMRDFNLAGPVLKQKADELIVINRNIAHSQGLNFIIHLFFIILFNPKLQYA